MVCIWHKLLHTVHDGKVGHHISGWVCKEWKPSEMHSISLKRTPPKPRKIKKQEKKNRQKFAAYTNSLKNIDWHICKFTKLTWSYKNEKKRAQWNFIPCAQVFSHTAHVHIHMSYFLFILHVIEVWISPAFQFIWENWRKLFVLQKETMKPEAKDLELSKIKR